MTQYPAIIERAGDAYSVFFPDVPGCTSAGDTIGDAIKNATEALSAHLELDDRSYTSSRLDLIGHDPNLAEVCRVMIAP